jgi:Flagellar motor switch/type III secretory pathway protein
MRDFGSSVAAIALELGGGWLSRYELSRLEPGAVVRSDTDAGSAQRLMMNGGYLCEASVVVGGDRLLARIERLEPEVPPEPSPERGDEATELLPFVIRMGTIEIALSELEGLGELSFIDFAKSLGEREDAELLACGLAVAAGKIVVIDERLGIRITRLLASGFGAAEPRTTGALLGRGYSAEPVKDYDFRRPDCFTKRGIDRSREAQLEFLRALQSMLPAAAGYRLALVDQLCYDEWLREQPASGRSYRLLPASPLRVAERGVGRLPAKLVVGPSGSSLPEGVLDALKGYAEQRLQIMAAYNRPIIVALGGAARNFAEEDPGLRVFGSCLRSGWKRAADLRFGPATERETPPGDDVAYRNEMILYVKFEGPGEGLCEIVYPIRALEARFAALNR